MAVRPSAYHRPKSLEEALRLLSQPDTMALAGGTTLLSEGPRVAVVDLQDLGLDRIQMEAGQLRLGAMTRLVDLDLADAASTTRAALIEGGLALHRSEVVRPSLEDVFVAATQERKALRDDAA